MKKRLLATILILVLATMTLSGCIFVELGKDSTVTLFFETNGGSAVESLVEKSGVIIHAPDAPTRAGYEFEGWYRDEAFSVPYVFGVMPSEDTTLYAKWKRLGYDVTLVGNGGNGTALTHYDDGVETALPNDWQKSGYKFAGWYEQSDFSDNRCETIPSTATGDKTFYAKWVEAEPGVYIVTLNGNGGTGEVLDSYKRGVGAVLPEWTHEGCDFGGWYASATFEGARVTEIGVLDRGDKTFYARWIPRTYTLTFESNGGSAVESMVVPYATVIEAPVPTYTDKVFAGWYRDVALTDEFVFDTMPAENITLYAKWIDGFNIIYKSEDVTVHEEMTSSSSIVLIDPLMYSFNRPDYFFDGWYKDSAYTEKCGTILNVTRSMTLYAKWTHRSFLPYVDKFEASVNKSTPAVINSKRELVAYIDYICTADNGVDSYFVKMPYLARSSAFDAINEAISLSTTYVPNGMQTQERRGYVEIILDKNRVLDHFAPVPNQISGIAEKAYHGLKPVYTPIRDNAYEFKYEEYTDTMQVTTSDQLFYALQYGIKPLPVAGSSADRLLTKAENIARSICDDTMTDVEKLYAIFSWFIENVGYDHEAARIAGSVDNITKYDAWHLEGVFDNNIAVCDGISKAVTVLARIEGIPCVRVTSNPLIEGNVLKVEGHAWNKVYVDIDGNGVKEWYNLDATWGNVGVSSNGTIYEMGDISSFLFKDETRSSATKPRISANQLDLKANTDVNVYRELDFSYNGKPYDLYIDNQSDADTLMYYLHDILNEKSMPSKYMSVSVGGASKASVENMLTSAMNKANRQKFTDKDFKGLSSTTDNRSLLFILAV